MPDVRMPDGTIIRNVPEGTTKAQLQAKAAAANPKQRDTAMGGIDAFMRGAADVATFGTADKIDAAINSVIPINRLGGQKVKSVWDGSSLSDAFRSNLKLNNVIDRADAQVNPVAQTSGQVAGALVGPVPGRALIGKAALKLGRAAIPATVAGEAAVQSGLYGAGSGNSTSVTDRLQNAGSQAMRGTAGALAGYGLIKGGARALSPRVSSEVADLANAGVTMTPGQRGGAITRFMEQGAESIPFVGAPIRAAKGRAVGQFNKAWTNEALKPIGKALPADVKPGHESVAFAQKAVSQAYDDALSGITAPADEIFAKRLADVDAESAKLPADQKANFDAIMNLRVKPLLAGKANLDGKTFQAVYRSLQRDIAGFRSKGDPIADITGEMLGDVLDNFKDLAERYAGPSAKAFKAANEASARLSRVEDAASKAQSVGGVFTPSTAAQAAARKGYGTTAKNLATGEARMQSLAAAAKKVLPDTLPNSGTADRAAFLAMLTAGGSGAAGASLSPALAAPAPLLAPYIPGLDKLFQKASLRGQSPALRELANQIRSKAYVGGMFGVPLAIDKAK